MTFYMAGEGRRMFGQTVPSELRNKFAMSVRQPLGVCSIITPWNFPMAIPSWKIIPALVCGNTVVFKPASQTPLSALNFVKVLEEAGVPQGRRQHGHRRRRRGRHADDDHDRACRVVSFTGSTHVGRIVNQAAAPAFKKVHLEMGGKNVIMIMDDANLELAVDGCLWGGFGTTGQRCTAASRVVVHEKVYKTFVDAFVARAKSLVVGDGLDAETEMGPSNSESAAADGHEVRRDRPGGRGDARAAAGNRLDAGAYAKGFFHEPTIFVDVDAGDANRAGGDLRAGRVGDPVHVARRGDRDRQRRRVRPVGVDLHAGHQPRVHGDARSLHRHLLRQCADDRRRSAPAVRRHEEHRQRPPRGRRRGAGRVLGMEVDLHRLQRQAPARADRLCEQIVTIGADCVRSADSESRMDAHHRLLRTPRGHDLCLIFRADSMLKFALLLNLGLFARICSSVLTVCRASTPLSAAASRAPAPHWRSSATLPAPASDCVCIAIIVRRRRWAGASGCSGTRCHRHGAVVIGHLGWAFDDLRPRAQSWVQWHTLFSLCGGIAPLVALFARPHRGARTDAARERRLAARRLRAAGGLHLRVFRPDSERWCPAPAIAEVTLLQLVQVNRALLFGVHGGVGGDRARATPWY